MKSSLIHLISAVLVCSAALAGYGTWYAFISAKSITVADLQKQIDTKVETVSRVASTYATLAGIVDDETVVQNYFVPEAGVVAFINVLEMQGKAQGTTVNVLSVSTMNTSARPSLALLFSIKGTFDAVMRTVGSIEYMPYNLSVTTLSLRKDDKNSWHADLKLIVGSRASGTATTSSSSDALRTRTP